MPREHGGAVAKLLGVLLIVVVLASAALYLYTKQQRPLALGTAHVATSVGSIDPATLRAAPGDRVWVATIVRNTGRLPVRIDALRADSGPWTTTAAGLGDGEDPMTAAAFSPFPLDPGEGVGVVVAVTVDPSVPCVRLDEPEPLPAIAVEYTSYGITSTQTLPLDAEPAVTGLAAACAAAA